MFINWIQNGRSFFKCHLPTLLPSASKIFAPAEKKNIKITIWYGCYTRNKTNNSFSLLQDKAKNLPSLLFYFSFPTLLIPVTKEFSTLWVIASKRRIRKYESLRFDSSWGLRSPPLFHARDKTKRHISFVLPSI